MSGMRPLDTARMAHMSPAVCLIAMLGAELSYLGYTLLHAQAKICTREWAGRYIVQAHHACLCSPSQLGSMLLQPT